MNGSDKANSHKQVVILYNPFAGRGESLKMARDAEQFAIGKGWRVLSCTGSLYAGHIAEVLVETETKEADLVILIGGDGTLRELISGLIKHRLRPEIAFIPMGNANVVARELKIPLKPHKALLMLNASKTTEVDIGLVDLRQAEGKAQNQIFLAMLEIGLGAKIVHLVNHLRLGKLQRLYQLWGDLVYALAGLFAFSKKEIETVQCTLQAGTTKDPAQQFNTAQLIVANMQTYAKGWSFTPDANYQDGMLDVAFATKNNRFAALTGFIAAANKRKQAPDRMRYTTTRALDLNGSDKLFMQIDGDPVAFSGSARISLQAKAFIIHIPADI